MVSASEKPIRILLVDDHTSVRAGYRMLIGAQRGMIVAGEAASSDEALSIAAHEPLDIILLDLDLGPRSRESGLEIIPKLKTSSPGVRVLVLTGLSDTEIHQEVARRGASGLVSKEQSVTLLIKAIEKVHRGELWFDRSLLGAILSERSESKEKQQPELAKIASLTDREREIINLVAQGLKNKEIGQRLNPRIGEKTVRNHLNTIFSKLAVASRFELLIFAYRHGLASPPT